MEMLASSLSAFHRQFRCSSCQGELPVEALFCAWCGDRQAEPCGGCGCRFEAGWRHCAGCGQARPEPRAAEASPVDPPSREVTGDRRVVTVLFADVSGFTAMSEKLDPQTVAEIVNEFFAVLTEPIYRYGGVVDKYIGDAIMALFGAPVAHEDDPERACRAAFEMQQVAFAFAQNLLARTGITLRVRVGIHTGLVVAGNVGGQHKRDYTVLGETVNLAQRLESACRPGNVLVSHVTYRAATRGILFQSLGAVRLKGMNEDIQVYEVSGLADDPGTRLDTIPLSGREAELEVLQEVFRQAKDEASRLVWLVGEAGIGKSRLSSALFESLRPDWHVDAQRVRAISYDQATPYALLADFIRRWLGASRNRSDSLVEALSTRVEACPEIDPGERDQHVAAIAQLVGSALEHPELEQLSPQQRRIFSFRALNRLLISEARRRPMLLNFEDLHWADEASLEWLQSLAEMLGSREAAQAHVLLLGQTREYEGRVFAGWKLAMPVKVLVLRALSEPASWKTLLAHLGAGVEEEGLRPDVRTVLGQILVRAEGNPLFLHELFRALVEAGTLVRDAEGAWKVEGQGQGALPTTINGVVLARIDRLSPAHRAVLHLASVVGRAFQPSLLARVEPMAQLDDILRDLAGLDFVVRKATGEWQFLQALNHEVVYNSMLLSVRKELHRRVGLTLEAGLGERALEVPQVLARHFMAGDVPEKALRYLHRSGELALRNFSNLEALTCFQECLRLLDAGARTEQPRRYSVLIALAELLGTTGQYAPALESLDQALEVAADPAERADVLRRIGGIVYLQGNYQDAMDRYAAGLEALADVPAPLVRARILLDQELALFRQGQFQTVLDLCEQSLSMLEGTSFLKEIATTHSIIGLVYYRQNRLTEAEKYHKRALSLREQQLDVFGVAASLNNLGVIYLELGDWKRSAEHYARSLKIYQQIGDLGRQVIQLNNLGDLYRNRGKPEESRDMHRKALEIAEEIGDLHGAGVATHGLGLANMVSGSLPLAIAQLEEGLARFTEMNMQEVLAEVSGDLAQAYLLDGQLDAAEEHIATARGLATEQGMSFQDARILSLEAQLCLGRGNLEDAIARIEAAFLAMGEDPPPIDHGRICAVDAQIRLAAGQRDQARERVAQARSIFEQLGALCELDNLAPVEQVL